MRILRRSLPGRGNSWCKGPEAGACLQCLRNNEAPGVTEAEEAWAREGSLEN